MIDLAQFKNKRVLILGLGQNQGGVGAAAFFARLGARVTVTDLKTERELGASLEQLAKYPEIEYVLGRHRDEDIRAAQLIIKNPAIPSDSPYLLLAHKLGVPVESDVSLFFELCAAPIIGVTGTKGKTTTTTLVAELLRAQFGAREVVAAGNLQVSVFDALGEMGEQVSDKKIVLELSSFALETLAIHSKSPHIACMTNFFADHLNRYDSLESYFQAKAQIFAHQSSDDMCVLNYESEIIRAHAAQVKSRVIWFSRECAPGAHVCVRDGQICATGFAGFVDHAPIAPIESIKLAGEHNLQNVLAACAVALCAGVEPRAIKQVLREFSGVAFRLEKIGEYEGVTFINDTSSTVPESTEVSLRAYPGAVLISGGSDKGLDVKKLARAIAEHARAVVLLPGTATDALVLFLEKEIREQGKSVQVTRAQTMRDAVDQAISIARANDHNTILLSPGLTSFGLFQNEFDRGRQFNQAIKEHYKNGASANE